MASCIYKQRRHDDAAVGANDAHEDHHYTKERAQQGFAPEKSDAGAHGESRRRGHRPDYKAPSAEEAAVASQAAKRPPVVNYPGEGFREMTKAQWAALPRDCKAVRSVAEAEDHGAYRYRRTMDNNFRLVNVYITDMKITEIPQK